MWYGKRLTGARRAARSAGTRGWEADDSPQGVVHCVKELGTEPGTPPGSGGAVFLVCLVLNSCGEFHSLRSSSSARGEYRLGGFYAGQCYLIALPHNPPADAQGIPKRTGFGNTFYPGVASFAASRASRTRSCPSQRHAADGATRRG